MADRPTISLITITRDEERLIGQCLKSAWFCDELIVVDSCSTDRTVQIAKSLGATVVEQDPSIVANLVTSPRSLAAGIESFMRHDALLDAARRLHGREVIEPAIGYANVLLPGQELAVHTDVPEFRGANRKVVPEWLLVVMHHAGLFERWRMPIATGISYFGGGRGGELAYYPDGAAGDAATYAPSHNTAVVLDTDSVFHGVDRVLGDERALGRIRPGMRLHYEGDRRWTVRDGDEVISSYDEDEIRLSISWKAYCFTDEGERAAWRTKADDLSLEMILATLVEDLRARGRLDRNGGRPPDAELGRLLINEYVRFPAPTPAP